MFETTSKNAKLLEKKIGKRLREALGYEVGRFAEWAKETPKYMKGEDDG